MEDLKQKKYTYSKEKVKEYNSKFFNNNKEKKITCEICNKQFSYFGKWKHEQSKFHQALKLAKLL
jgi:hypothetical protein